MAGGLEEASGLAWGVLQNQRFFGVPVSLLFPTPSGFPGGSTGKESACNVRDLGSIPGLGRSPGGGHVNPLQCSFLENPMDRGAMVGYSPWGRKDSDTTEQLSMHVY